MADKPAYDLGDAEQVLAQCWELFDELTDRAAHRNGWPARSDARIAFARRVAQNERLRRRIDAELGQ